MTHSVLRVAMHGLTFPVLAWGEEGAPRGSALLLHGYMDAAANWDLTAPALAAAGFRVLAPDLRGYGDGPRTPEGSYYHFPDYVRDVEGLHRALAADEPLLLVGHSMGGVVSTLYAGTFPESVARLVLIEGLGPPDNPKGVGVARMRAFVETTRRAATLEAPMTEEHALRRLRVHHTRISNELLRSRFRNLARQVGPDAYLWKSDPLHKTRSPTPFSAETFREFAAAYPGPVLFVGGGESGYHPPDEDARLAAFADVRRVDVDDAGHMVHWVAPEALAAAIVAFSTT